MIFSIFKILFQNCCKIHLKILNKFWPKNFSWRFWPHCGLQWRRPRPLLQLELRSPVNIPAGGNLHFTSLGCRLLEPVCCKKQQKKVPNQLLVCGIGEFWRTWMIPNWLYESKRFHWSSRINFIPFRIFRGPIFHKPVTGQELLLLFLTANRL